MVDGPGLGHSVFHPLGEVEGYPCVAMTKPVSELLRRYSALVGSDHRCWEDWERALHRFAVCNREVDRAKATWERRVARAMRGVGPKTWWRRHARIAAGELWVAPNASARRVERVVRATSRGVLDLVRRRDDDLGQLLSARGSAETDLRAATVALVASLGVERVASVLDLRPAMVRSLCSSDHPGDRLGELLLQTT
jgi:hypothetical protein